MVYARRYSVSFKLCDLSKPTDKWSTLFPWSFCIHDYLENIQILPCMTVWNRSPLCSGNAGSSWHVLWTLITLHFVLTYSWLELHAPRPHDNKDLAKLVMVLDRGKHKEREACYAVNWNMRVHILYESEINYKTFEDWLNSKVTWWRTPW